MVNQTNTYANSVNELLNKFNKIIDRIIEGIKEGNLDEQKFNKLHVAINEFIKFSKDITFPIIFSFVNSNDYIRDKLSNDFSEIKFMVLKLLDKLLESMDNIKDNTHGTYNLTILLEYLEFISVIMNNFAYIIYDTIKYSQGQVTEEDYQKHYDEFKINLKENKKNFDEKFR
ncbi:MAG: hypothetical protein PUA60_00490 [Methanobacteriaceae archaeon]|nr:hypothetical protein [Methanobacteriaceae archaeon]